MKGLALETIWIVIIAIAGILLFLALITGTLKPAANTIYCNIYLKILSLFSQTKSSIPDYCLTDIEGPVKIEEIKDVDKLIVARKILAFIISCWQDAEIRGYYVTHGCFELHLKNPVDNVQEFDVSQVLLNEDLCRSIENSDYGCGEKDQIIWSIENGIINTQKIVFIQYDGKRQAVEVIG